MLTENTQLAKALLKVRVGDQIRFRGQLAEYSHNVGFPFKRGTSTVRTDSGNGACETVYVDDIKIIKAGGQPWRMLVWAAGIMVVLSLIAWFLQPARFYD